MTTTAITVLPELAVKAVSQVTTKEHVVASKEDIQKFCEEATKFIHEKTLPLTKKKTWVKVVQDKQHPDRIVAEICGPMRKTSDDGHDKYGPLFSIIIPLFSAKTLGPMLPYNKFNNHWANKDFLKRMNLATAALIELMDNVEKKVTA